MERDPKRLRGQQTFCKELAWVGGSKSRSGVGYHCRRFLIDTYKRMPMDHMHESPCPVFLYNGFVSMTSFAFYPIVFVHMPG